MVRSTSAFTSVPYSVRRRQQHSSSLLEHVFYGLYDKQSVGGSLGVHTITKGRYEGLDLRFRYSTQMRQIECISLDKEQAVGDGRPASKLRDISLGLDIYIMGPQVDSTACPHTRTSVAHYPNRRLYIMAFWNQRDEHLYCDERDHNHVAHCYHSQRILHEAVMNLEGFSVGFVESLRKCDGEYDTELCTELAKQVEMANLRLSKFPHRCSINGCDTGAEWTCQPIPTIAVDERSEVGRAQVQISDFHDMLVPRFRNYFTKHLVHSGCDQCLGDAGDMEIILSAGFRVAPVETSTETGRARTQNSMRALCEMLEYVWASVIAADVEGIIMYGGFPGGPPRPAFVLQGQPSTIAVEKVLPNTSDETMDVNTTKQDRETILANLKLQLEPSSTEDVRTRLANDPSYPWNLISLSLIMDHPLNHALYVSHGKLSRLFSKLAVTCDDHSKRPTGVLSHLSREEIEKQRATCVEKLAAFRRALQETTEKECLDNSLNILLTHYEMLCAADSSIARYMATEPGSLSALQEAESHEILRLFGERQVRLVPSSTNETPIGLICDHVFAFVSRVVTLLIDISVELPQQPGLAYGKSPHDRGGEECIRDDPSFGDCECMEALAEINKTHKKACFAVKQLYDGLSAGQEAEIGAKLRQTLRAVWLDARKCLNLDATRDDPEEGTEPEWDGKTDFCQHSDIEDSDLDNEDPGEEDWSEGEEQGDGNLDFDAAGVEERQEGGHELGRDASEDQVGEGLVVEMSNLTVEDAMDVDN